MRSAQGWGPFATKSDFFHLLGSESNLIPTRLLMWAWRTATSLTSFSFNVATRLPAACTLQLPSHQQNHR